MFFSIFESLGMNHDVERNCNNSGNVMTPVADDYTNDDQHKSYFFSNCSIDSLIWKVTKIDA